MSDSAVSIPAAAPEAAVVATREAPAAPAITVTREDPQVAVDRGITAERQRIGTINDIATQARAQGVTVDANKAISSGATPDIFRQTVLDAIIARQASFTPGTPSRTEQRDLNEFSIVRGIQSIAQGRGLTGIELEMHQEAQREANNSGLSVRGHFTIPTVILNHGRRDMTATGGSNGSEGGATIATTFGSFIDLLYAKMVLRSLGAQFLTGLVGNVDLPKLLTGSTAVKKTEIEAGSESSPTTGVISLSPNRLGTYVEVSKQLLAQSSLSIEGMIRNDLATAIALGMEAGAINGGGTTEPTGILNTGSIGSVAGGTDGAAPTYAHVIALETAVAVANADMGSLAYLTNPKVRGKLRSTAKVASSDSVMVWDSMPYNSAITTQVPSNLEKGSSGAVCSAIIFGNFADLVVGQWGGIDIQVDPYTLATTGQVRILADTYYDSAVRRAGSFAAMKDALTA